MNKLKCWIATDGLLHILVSIVIMLCLQPLVGMLLSVCITLLIGLFKEFYDGIIQKDNNVEQVLHDVVCDVIGIIISIGVIYLMW
jgi:capsular polysaccharide biosynthesis protein